MQSELVLTPPEPMALTHHPNSMAELMQSAIQAAIQQGAGLEVVDRLIRGQREAIEHQEKIAFNDALARVQAKVRKVAVNAKNSQTGSQYATYTALDTVVRPIYIDEGLSLSFDTADVDKPDMVRVVCDASLGGYTRRYHIDMPADGKGAKGGDVMTRTHATGSAVSYGKRYLLLMIFNLTIGGEHDDDGNKAGGGTMQDRDYIPLMDNIENAKTIGEVTRFYLAALKAAGIVGDKAAIQKFEEAANKRKAELK